MEEEIHVYSRHANKGKKESEENNQDGTQNQ